MRTREDETTHLVTTASESPQRERRDRERRYLTMMALRVVCIIIAVVFAHGWILVVAVALSLILPWIAVVSANAVAKPKPGGSPTLYSQRDRHSLR